MTSPRRHSEPSSARSGIARSGWGLGINVGVADHIAAGLDRLIQELAHRHGSTIDIVGWSAGGLLARLLAQHRQELVGQVITLGSPIRLRTGDSNIGLLQEIAGHLFVPTPPRIDVDEIPVPSTTIWTKQDGVVPGRLCRQTPGPTAECVQVRGTHLGLATNPAVMYAIADRLAQRPDAWQPFTPHRRLRWWYPSLEQEHSDASAVTDLRPRCSPQKPTPTSDINRCVSSSLRTPTADISHSRALRSVIEESLHRAPSLRRRVRHVPLELDDPWWIEDPHFDLDYHIRHLAVPGASDRTHWSSSSHASTSARSTGIARCGSST